MTNCSKLLLAGAAMVFAASAACAQDYNRPDYGPGGLYPNGPSENVVIYAPRFHVERGHLGGPIETASMSEPVRYDDLDLTTAWGAHELRSRVRFTAAALCRHLDALYPVGVDSTPCYKTAVEDGLLRADRAIDAERT